MILFVVVMLTLEKKLEQKLSDAWGGVEKTDREMPNNLQLIVSRLIFFFIGSAVLSIGLQKFAESLQCAFTVVINDFVITLPEQFDGGEALDLDIFQFVGG